MYAGDIEAFFNYGAKTYNYWRRNQFMVNVIRPKIEMIVGNQIKNRKTYSARVPVPGTSGRSLKVPSLVDAERKFIQSNL